MTIIRKEREFCAASAIRSTREGQQDLTKGQDLHVLCERACGECVCVVVTGLSNLQMNGIYMLQQKRLIDQ